MDGLLVIHCLHCLREDRFFAKRLTSLCLRDRALIILQVEVFIGLTFESFSSYYIKLYQFKTKSRGT